MDNMQKSMKYSIIFGLCGAVILPFIYEIYANVSSTFGILLWTGGIIFAGVKFSSLDFKEAFLGITCTIAYSGIFGGIFYMFIHPKIMDFLINRSVYFQLTLKQQLTFIGYIFFISIVMYVIWAMKFLAKRTFAKLKNNSEKAGDYIENAFSEENEENKL